ncbi:Ca2+ transporter [Lepidopterella palustris CBS 459.81]|uniref:Ca2+ transporter n=1 Tax=Lepidopterella palustris CBS 459.81 TaxID=1314670 RepID=A0A8E2ELM8_9PEZI|nr:Ca2+ transporter [Lepidopterella palustris CBS 459.81]
MANPDIVAFNIATFISTFFLLEFASDKFVDHTAVVASRVGVSQAVIALLTAGAEWEELGVVVASLSRSRSSLAFGNIIGSAISNILGAFSLGLIAHSNEYQVTFDKSSRIYSLNLLLLTTVVTAVIYFAPEDAWTIFGGLLLAVFTIYTLSIVWAISRGNLTAPEDSDKDSESETSNEESPNPIADNNALDANQPLLQSDEEHASYGTPTRSPIASRGPRHSLLYHIAYLIFGFLAISLAAYVISHAATNITNQFQVSDFLFGVVLLAIATTLPEKFIAVLSGHRGHMGILVANTAGSNIFLLSLCLGIIMVGTNGHLDADSVNVAELAILWGSTLLFTVTVFVGGIWSRWIGIAMLILYFSFLVLEFVLIRRV